MSINEYIANGRAYQVKADEMVAPTGGGMAMFYVGDLFGGNSKIPASWNLGAAQYSFQIEQIGLRVP